MRRLAIEIVQDFDSRYDVSSGKEVLRFGRLVRRNFGTTILVFWQDLAWQIETNSVFSRRLHSESEAFHKWHSLSLFWDIVQRL